MKEVGLLLKSGAVVVACGGGVPVVRQGETCLGRISGGELRDNANREASVRRNLRP